MLCCLLAGLLAFAGVKGRRQTGPSSARPGASGERIPPRRVARLVGFGWCCGVLAFEFIAAVAAGTGGLRTLRPSLLLIVSQRSPQAEGCSPEAAGRRTAGGDGRCSP